MHTLELDGISKRFRGVEVLRSISFSVQTGQRVVLSGESGSGKTTLLRIIAGLEKPDAGRVILNGMDITSWPPNRRSAAVVFQDYATYPRLSVLENLKVSLVGGGLTKAEADSRVAEVVSWLELENLVTRLPPELSGGQLQRVAIGKAIIGRPKLLLLDEPFSQLDVRLAEQLRRLLEDCHARHTMAQLMVSHQPLDAICGADKVAVLSRCELAQFATPDEVRRRPANRFAAELTSPCGLNALPSELFPQLVLPSKTNLLFRPEHVRMSVENEMAASIENEVSFRAKLGRCCELGIVRMQEAHVSHHKIWLRCCPEGQQLSVPEDNTVTLRIRREDLMILPG